MTSEPTLLDAILAPGGLRISLQPIFDLSGPSERVAAVECLARGPAGTNLERANVLFEYVRRKKEETVVDRACVLAGLTVAGTLPHAIDIDVNVHASTLGRDPGFVSFLEEAAGGVGVDPSRIVVEIVEHFPYWDSVAFFDSLQAIRAAGMRIALDDVGAGNSNFSMMIDVEPDFLKIDRYLITGCDSHKYRRVVLESVHHLASRTGAPRRRGRRDRRGARHAHGDRDQPDPGVPSFPEPLARRASQERNPRAAAAALAPCRGPKLDLRSPRPPLASFFPPGRPK